MSNYKQGNGFRKARRLATHAAKACGEAYVVVDKGIYSNERYEVLPESMSDGAHILCRVGVDGYAISSRESRANN